MNIHIPMSSNLSIEAQDVLYYIFKKRYMTFTNPTDFEDLKKEFGAKISHFRLKDILEGLENYNYIYTKTKRDLKGVCEDKRNIKKGVPFKISEANRCGVDIEELDIGIMSPEKLLKIEDQFGYRIFFEKIISKKIILMIIIAFIPMVLYTKYEFREIKEIISIIIGTIIAELVIFYIIKDNSN